MSDAAPVKSPASRSKLSGCIRDLRPPLRAGASWAALNGNRGFPEQALDLVACRSGSGVFQIEDLRLKNRERRKRRGIKPVPNKRSTWSIFFRSSRILGIVFWVFLSSSAGWGERIVNTKHNLSTTGPGTVQATTETAHCIFCHTPHTSVPDAPLWNRSSSGAHYTPYDSTTMVATVGQPTGSSKFCLSCHDGTIAIGLVHNKAREIRITGAMPADGMLSNDLSDDHPISFVFDSALAAANGQLHNPSTLTGAVALENGLIQCSTCHDPHDNQFGDFLTMDNTASALCRACHNQDSWIGSSHEFSSATWNSSLPDPWPHTDFTTVADNACENCHRPHSAGTPERLLNNLTEESNCFPCHNGNVGSTDVESDFNKFSAHPVLNTTGVHDPTEDLVNPARHVECADCHDPHAVNPTPATAPLASGALGGVKGISIDGSVADPVVNEYELCFRCHADSIDRGPAVITRQVPQTNTRLEFDPSNTSYHPVAAVGKNPNVPSLIAPLDETSRMYCTDCHNSDQSPAAGGAGPNGPHGSTWPPILERELALTDVPESPSAHALCYKCHDRDYLLSTGNFHSQHIDKGSACTSCHDPHGAVENRFMINFNTDLVRPNRNRQLEWIDNGDGTGTCSLKCHQTDHELENY